MKKRLLSFALVGALAVGAFAGCGSDETNSQAETAQSKEQTQTTEQTQSTEQTQTADAPQTTDATSGEKEHVTIRLADQAVNQILAYHYAQELGLYDKYFADAAYDVDFEFYDFANGPAANEAIAAGQLEFTIEGTLPSVTGPLSGYGTVVVAVGGVNTSSGGAIVAPADSDIYTLEDTKGKVVGTAIGTAYHYSLARFYEAAGISLDEVELINAGTDVSTAIRAGEISAGFATLPQAKILEEEGSGRVISDELIITAPTQYVIASREFAEKYPDLTTRVLKALAEAEETLVADPEPFKAYYTAFLGTDSTPYTDALLSTQVKITPVDDLAYSEIGLMIDWLDRNGLADVTGKSADDVFDNTYVNAAVGE